MVSYIDTIYDIKKRPYTKYPFELCNYLCGRFGIKKGSKLLDVGCGRGDFLKNFKDLGLDATGLDIEKIEPTVSEDVKIYTCNFETDNFPFENESFDVIFSKSVIEHLKNPENLIKEARRILKPDGRIIILTPDWQSQIKIFYDDYTHVHPYTTTGLHDLLKIFNFKNVSSEKFYQLPILWKMPILKIISRTLHIFGPVKKIYKNKFIRWSRELMILAYGEK